MTIKVKDITPNAVVEKVAALSDDELDELCEAAEKAILDGNGFGWLTPPPRRVLESYWRGVLLMPQRDLFVARLDGAIVGSTQLLRPPPNNEAQAHAAQLTTFFIAPWARGHRSEEHTSELQSLMRISYAVFCLKKKNDTTRIHT